MLLALLCSFSQARADFWYYNLDETPLYVEVFENLVAVKFDPSLHGPS
jgi:hypothetical protein